MCKKGLSFAYLLSVLNTVYSILFFLGEQHFPDFQLGLGFYCLYKIFMPIRQEISFPHQSPQAYNCMDGMHPSL